jgi:hypothetical protein
MRRSDTVGISKAGALEQPKVLGDPYSTSDFQVIDSPASGSGLKSQLPVW